MTHKHKSLHMTESLKRLALSLDSFKRQKLCNQLDIPTRRDIALIKKSKLEEGHRIVDAVRDFLETRIDKLLRRTEVQVTAHELMLSSLARFIYKESLLDNEEAIKKRNNWENIGTGVLISAPRQTGKTATVVMMCTALIVCVPNVIITCIANSQNAAGVDVGFIGKIRELLVKCGISRSETETNNASTIAYRVGVHDVRKLSSFSAMVGDR